MTCRELIETADALVADELPPLRRRLLLAHLARCSGCSAYFDSYRKTILLARTAASVPESGGDERVPEGFVRSVVAAVGRSKTQLWHVLAAVAASPLLFFYFGAK